MPFNSFEIRDLFNDETKFERVFHNGGRQINRSPTLDEQEGSFDNLVSQIERSLELE